MVIEAIYRERKPIEGRPHKSKQWSKPNFSFCTLKKGMYLMDISIRQTQTQIKLSDETKFSFQPIAVKDVNFNLKNSAHLS